MIRRLGTAWVWIVYAFLYIPILVVIAYSFNTSKYSTSWSGFTLDWYTKLLSNSSLVDAALNSLSIATISACCATVLGSLAAVCLHRYRFPGRKVLHGSIYMLTVSPDIVMGISLLIFFITVRMELGFLTLLIAHITLGLPFVTVTVLARLAEFDENLVEAARDLGASEWNAFRHIMLPLALPAVAAGWLLSFTLSMDDVLISFFVTGPTFEVLPLKIYSMVRLGVKPDINALSAIMFCLTVILVLLAQMLANMKKK
ncbi:MAG: spermidine/putrescine ABC transporter permease PotC [Pseudomonadota bacterium]